MVNLVYLWAFANGDRFPHPCFGLFAQAQPQPRPGRHQHATVVDFYAFIEQRQVAGGDLNLGDAVVGVVGDARCHVLCLSVCSFIKSPGLD